VFSPMFFNTIDWTETDQFARPIVELRDQLNDKRVVGLHLWNAKTHSTAREDDRSLIATLSRLPSLTDLADRFDTDKNRHTGNRHAYARAYDQLLGGERFALRRLMEVGVTPAQLDSDRAPPPSVAFWRAYFPFCEIVGVDPKDLSRLDVGGFTALLCDLSEPQALHAAAATLDPGSFDVIIDDASHASANQQAALAAFWPLLADGGWYFIEDLDWQPPGEDEDAIALTKTLLREIERGAGRSALDPHGVAKMAHQFGQILFFDSHYELDRAGLMGGLVAISKRVGMRA
jgi:hypothetical protein